MDKLAEIEQFAKCEKTAGPGRRVAILPVTRELLSNVLHLPDSAQIVDIITDRTIYQGVIDLIVESPDFPEVQPGQQMRRVSAWFNNAYRRLIDPETGETEHIPGPHFDHWEGLE